MEKVLCTSIHLDPINNYLVVKLELLILLVTFFAI